MKDATVQPVPLAVDGAPAQQHTLAGTVTRTGVGLHSGATVTVRLRPAAAHTGRRFRRCDRPDAPEIPALAAQVHQTQLSTELRQGEATVRTVEHLLAALVGQGIDNVLIDIDGPEVPLLDGSAQEWVAAIAQAGSVPQDAPRVCPPLTEPLWVRDGAAFVAALPAPQQRFTYGIDFDVPAIGNQWHSWTPDSEPFATAIAPARTFGLLEQIEFLRRQGLIQGGSLENALVCGPDGWVNPPLRFENEPVRHKLLDLIGDLSLVGPIPVAHFLAYKASHQLHTQLARSLVAANR